MTKEKTKEILDRVFAKLTSEQKNAITEYIAKSENAYKIGAREKALYNDGLATGYVACLHNMGVISYCDAIDMYAVINS